MNNKNRIYKSKKIGAIYPVKEVGGFIEINFETPIIVDLSEYKKVGENSVFIIYDKKSATH